MERRRLPVNPATLVMGCASRDNRAMGRNEQSFLMEIAGPKIEVPDLLRFEDARNHSLSNKIMSRLRDLEREYNELVELPEMEPVRRGLPDQLPDAPESGLLPVRVGCRSEISLTHCSRGNGAILHLPRQDAPAQRGIFREGGGTRRLIRSDADPPESPAGRPARGALPGVVRTIPKGPKTGFAQNPSAGETSANPVFFNETINPDQGLPMVHVAALAQTSDGILHAVWYGGSAECRPT